MCVNPWKDEAGTMPCLGGRLYTSPEAAKGSDSMQPGSPAGWWEPQLVCLDDLHEAEGCLLYTDLMTLTVT